MTPAAQAAFRRLIAPTKELVAKIHALCEAIAADPEKYRDLLPMARAIQERLPQPKGRQQQKEAA